MACPSTLAGVEVLTEPVWRARAAAHAAAVAQRAGSHLARRARGEKHAVEDFLWEYYAVRPGQLARWHPGGGVGLEGAAERTTWRFYREVRPGLLAADVDALSTHHGRLIRQVRVLVEATVRRTPSWSCFGWHEWAMVYRADSTRHPAPLRLGPAATDALVEEVADRGGLRCTHFDAYRFFTADAAPLNAWRPASSDRASYEQAGCLHAGMDLYKHALRLLPLTSSALVLDAFDLARDLRYLDMRAAPYDLTHLGVEPLLMETADGRAAYVSEQRRYAERAQVLRRRLLDELSVAPSGPAHRPAEGVLRATELQVDQGLAELHRH